MKCPSCKAKWDLNTSISQFQVTECPFCHTPLNNPQETLPEETTAAGQLRRFVSNALKDFPNEEGSTIYKSYRFSALLSDLLARFPKGLRRCRMACEAKIPERLFYADKKSSEEQMECMRECVYVLKDGWDMEENVAKETVSLLVAGLGWKIIDETKRQVEKSDFGVKTETSETKQAFDFVDEELYEAIDQNIDLVKSLGMERIINANLRKREIVNSCG